MSNDSMIGGNEFSSSVVQSASSTNQQQDPPLSPTSTTISLGSAFFQWPPGRKSARLSSSSANGVAAGSSSSGQSATGCCVTSSDVSCNTSASSTSTIVSTTMIGSLAAAGAGIAQQQPPAAAVVDSKQAAAAVDSKGDSQKSRGWEPWNYETIGLFFDALKQHGKDFVQIKKYIMSKSKKKYGDTKNHHQIRNFYYNKCVALLNRLNLTEIDAPKEAKELFALIGYGELIKKTKGIKMSSQNFYAALTDLAKNGCTIVKMKPSPGGASIDASPTKKHVNHQHNKKNAGYSAPSGNNGNSSYSAPKSNKVVRIKIKIPVCEALKKFMKSSKTSAANSNRQASPSKTGKQRENLSETTSSTTALTITESETGLPKSVNFELTPKSIGDKTYVLDCEQNPLVRFSLTLNQPISRVFSWLEAKWTPKCARNTSAENFSPPIITLYPPNDLSLKSVHLAPKCDNSGAETALSPTTSSLSALMPVDRLGLRHCFAIRSGFGAMARKVLSQSHANSQSSHANSHSSHANSQSSHANSSSSSQANSQSSHANSSSSHANTIPNAAMLSPEPATNKETRSKPAAANQIASSSSSYIADQSETDLGQMMMSPEPPACNNKEAYSGECATTTDDEAEMMSDILDTTQCTTTEDAESLEEETCGGGGETNSSQVEVVEDVTLDAETVRNGLTADNCGGMTIGQLCLMCNGAANIRFLYKIESKSEESKDICPPWLCFVKLIRQNFVDILQKKTGEPTLKRKTPSIVKCKPPEDDDAQTKNTPVAPIDLYSVKSGKRTKFASPAEQQHQVVYEENEAFMMQCQEIFGGGGGGKNDENPRKIHKQPQFTRRQTFPVTSASAATSPNIMTVNPQMNPTVDTGQLGGTVTQQQGQSVLANSSANNCILIYSTPAALMATATTTPPNAAATMTAAQVDSLTNQIKAISGLSNQIQAVIGQSDDLNNQTVTMPINQLTSRATPAAVVTPLNTLTESIVTGTTKKAPTPPAGPISFAGILPDQPTPSVINKMDNLQVDVAPTSSHVPVLSDFSLGSASSLFGFLSCNTPQKKQNQGECSSNLHNFDFSLDSVKSAVNLNNSEDTILQRDFRRSFELMMHQDSSEYCKNFADLAGNLETPKKTCFLDDH